jgi:hypothetical protein
MNIILRRKYILISVLKIRSQALMYDKYLNKYETLK